MFKQKSVYVLGILFLFLGLIWLHSGHVLHHQETAHNTHTEHSGHSSHDNHDIEIGFSLWGTIPTLLGIYLIDKHNRELLKK